jgi:hypothetical protein
VGRLNLLLAHHVAGIEQWFDSKAQLWRFRNQLLNLGSERSGEPLRA